ncbi:MAG: TPM domain-containing protein, partial [Firmicutes bacterium]|nr:TPM domain-containing protein [Bacillota bacterium]
MKRKASVIIAALMILSLIAPLSVLAEGLYEEASPRLIDNGGALDAAHAQDLMNESKLFSEEYETDFVFVIVTPDEYQACRGRLGSLADDIYDDGGYGWGEDRSAVIALWCPEYEEYHYQTYGWVSELLDEDRIEFISERSPGYQEEYGDWGVLYASLRFTSNCLDDIFEEMNTLPPEVAGMLQGGQIPDQGQTVSEHPQPLSGSMPDWYPENVSNFQFYHDESAPRVVDTADIFTAEEEVAIEKRAREIIDRTGKDVVVFTDVSSYGLEQDVYCADFYDFNGYGFGPEREGLCLLFCMDPGDRGFMTVATGSETMALFTQSSSNAMDGLLYDYAVSARYGEGVLRWMDTVESLYIKGVPFAPDWLPDADEAFSRFHRGNGKGPSGYIDDKAGYFTAEEAEALSAKAGRICREYGIDIMMHTSRESYGMSRDEYNELYYYYNGLGKGDD